MKVQRIIQKSLESGSVWSEGGFVLLNTFKNVSSTCITSTVLLCDVGCYISAPQQVFCSAWWRCSSDVWQQLPVACFMPFICLHITTGSSGFQLDRWATVFCESACIMFPLHLHIDFKAHFSSPQELEREITFQEGSGLYYYYYKHLISAPSFERGLCTLSSSHAPQLALHSC